MINVTWNENEHLVIESVVDDKVGVRLIVEESGDAKNKVVHVNVDEQLQGQKVVFHS